MIVQHWRAQNDINGNPRRVFVLFDESGSIAGAIDEGYTSEPTETVDKLALPALLKFVHAHNAQKESLF